VVTEPIARRPRAIVLDIGQDAGALIVYTHRALFSREIEVSPAENAARRTHTEVLERTANGRTLYAAVFAELPAGAYSLWRDVMTDEDITIVGGSVTEVNWREVTDAASFRLAQPEGSTGLGQGRAVAPAPRGMLPARYSQGRQVNTAPMGSAPLQYGEDGAVAWDELWTDFCDLALAGGPRHRDTLLEPATPTEVEAAPEAYAHAVSEIERGLRLVTTAPIVKSPYPGWVGLRCEDAAMARWLLVAIAAENVSVRREEDLLFLPAAPSFHLEKEIKNVVTAVAKTHHYWLEHRRDAQRLTRAE